jgi:hypothetical protein
MPVRHVVCWAPPSLVPSLVPPLVPPLARAHFVTFAGFVGVAKGFDGMRAAGAS